MLNALLSMRLATQPSFVSSKHATFDGLQVINPELRYYYGIRYACAPLRQTGGARQARGTLTSPLLSLPLKTARAAFMEPRTWPCPPTLSAAFLALQVGLA